MFPELFKIPFIHLSVKSYGLMIAIGFLAAIFLLRRLSRDIITNPDLIITAALYSMIAGLVGARAFYVLHHLDRYRGQWTSIFAIWQGGLELLGGVLLVVPVILFYLWRRKLPIRRCLDILAIALLLALAFGRIGCFLNGCCFGKPTQVAWAIRFPYGSDAYYSQVYPNLSRNRPEPQLKLPAEFFGYHSKNGQWGRYLKPYTQLTEEQKYQVTKDKYRSLPVHPTQLYSSANAFLLSLLLYLFWRIGKRTEQKQVSRWFYPRPGCTFGLMFVLYGFSRFFLEFLRDDSPFEFDRLTISQNIAIALVLLGLIFMFAFARMKPDQTLLSPSK